MDTLEQLEAKMDKARERRDEAVDTLKNLTRERDALQATQTAEALTENMTDPQREALRTVLGVASAEPTSRVGTPEANP